MGVQSLFQRPNFSDIFEFESARRVDLVDLLHKAKIEIDKKGTTAEAATMLEADQAAGDSDFICNHPFVFVIHDQKTNEILFAGIYRGPKKEPVSKNIMEKFLGIFMQMKQSNK